MGKGTDKLYITHSEWASGDAFGASAGSAHLKAKASGAPFKRLPFNFCAVSLQPFTHPVCTRSGIIFELTNILPWLKKHGTNPVDGGALKSSELIKLQFAKNEDEEYVDPVTFKPFTDNTHIVALNNTGNVFAWDTVERLNVKPKNWHDLLSDAEFTRKDIITLQDPQNLESRDLNSFKYLKDGVSTLTNEQVAERADPVQNVNLSAIGSSAKILRAKEAVAKARAERAATKYPNHGSTSKSGSQDVTTTSVGQFTQSKARMSMPPTKANPYNAAQHTTGKAAASFTSTGLTPHTTNERALLTDEEYMLKPKRVLIKGYARLQTTHGDIALELHTEQAPKAVWNFIRLSQKGYYRNVPFHRNIRNFMLQGGDPTGTGRGGSSVWGQPFADEFATSPLFHDKRGVLSMANKGKNTNTSQFFILYRAASHLDRKHTVFGRVVLEGEAGAESATTLSRLENAETGTDDRPSGNCAIEDVVVFVDPFAEFLKQKANRDEAEKEQEEVARQGGTEDDNTTWTGKRVRDTAKPSVDDGGGGVGKYMSAFAPAPKISSQTVGVDDEVVGEWDELIEEPESKKRKAGGFNNFDGW